MNPLHLKIDLFKFKSLLKIKKDNGVIRILDPFRNKYVKADPEEWVRQLLLKYLVIDCAYPTGRISVEKSLTINKLNKRFDGLVYDEGMKPLVLIECKSPYIKLSTDTLNQIMIYNLKSNAPYIIISNGIDTVMGKVDFQEKSYLWFSKILSYKELI